MNDRQIVLLVDDEPMVRNLIRTTLQSLDCEVVEAGSGMEAVQLFKRRRARIALLLTDIAMPGMAGDELATILTGLFPELPVLFISATGKQLPPGLQHFQCLHKPFRLDVLTRTVANMLRDRGERMQPSGT